MTDKKRVDGVFLIQNIEEKRKQLHKCIEADNISYSEILECSKDLDDLIIIYLQHFYNIGTEL